jgi:hypothetical protein
MMQRMDVDSHLLYHRKVRKLQRQEPERWPAILVAWLGLLGEAWRNRTRTVSLEDSWCPAMTTVSLEDAEAALREVDLIDHDGHIAEDSWDEWFGPVNRRVEAGRNAAAARWDPNRNAYSPPSPPAKPAKPGDRLRSQPNGRSAAPVPLAEAMRAAGVELPNIITAAGGEPLTSD